ncbi:MAG: FkbM family methyltransferase [Edaphobacter sp.]
MSKLVDAFTASPVGSIVYKPIQRLVHYSRRRANPGIPVDHAIVQASYRDRQFSIEVDRWCGSQRLAIEQCFQDAQYDMPHGPHGVLLNRLYNNILTAGKKPLIVDCGANIGASVLWFTARYPEAHIIAVEPAPDNFALLRKNCNGRDIDLRQAGIGPTDGRAFLSNPLNESMGYRTTDTDGTEITILSVGTLLASKPQSIYSPFLLKVDIEGAEKSLFAGDTSAVNQFPLIILEPHDWLLPGQLTSVEFFRFHAENGREFAMKHENIASIAYHPDLLGIPASWPS